MEPSKDIEGSPSLRRRGSVFHDLDFADDLESPLYSFLVQRNQMMMPFRERFFQSRNHIFQLHIGFDLQVCPRTIILKVLVLDIFAASSAASRGKC